MDGSTEQTINYIWPAIGFALGTGAIGSLVLSTDIWDRGMGGILFGGIPFGLLGLWYASRRAKRGSK